MSKLKENEHIRGTCKHYAIDEYYCYKSGEHYKDKDDTCDNWESDDLTEEELEAQRVDAAERENHRKEVEGEIE